MTAHHAVKVQYGAAWWFLDQKSGMEKHLKDLAVTRIIKKIRWNGN